MSIPENLKYTKTNEWVLVEDAIATVGLTEYAQGALGDITYVDLPSTDKAFHQGDELGAVESVKAACDIFAPVSGHVCDVNDELEVTPDLMNKDPYGEGWIAKLDHLAPEELENLMDADEYAKHVESLKH